jgi:hypothetical protein
LHARRNSRRELTRRGASVYFPLYRPRVEAIDFNAELPELPFIDIAPSELPLEQLVFYRDDHPLIPKLCRYQNLWRRRLALATPEQYHHMREDAAGMVRRTWADSASCPRQL